MEPEELLTVAQTAGLLYRQAAGLRGIAWQSVPPQREQTERSALQPCWRASCCDWW